VLLAQTLAGTPQSDSTQVQKMWQETQESDIEKARLKVLSRKNLQMLAQKALSKIEEVDEEREATIV
jgi:hypothetical protein